MELLLRVRHATGEVEDVRVDLDSDRTVGDLAIALSRGAEAPPHLLIARLGVVIDPNMSVTQAGFLTGDEVVLDPATKLSAPVLIPIRGVSIDILSGVDAGQSAILGRGRFVVGRDTSCDLVLNDQAVSRRHVIIEVASDWSVSIDPIPDTLNGVEVNEVPVSGGVLVRGDDVVTIGDSRFALRPFIRSAGEVTDQLGQIEFHRTPYRPVVVNERKLPPLGPIPSRPEPRRFQLLSVLAPLAGGVAMFAFSRQPQFLALTALSPIMMVANLIEDKRQGRRKFDTQLAEFRAKVENRRLEMSRLLDEERIERLRSAPDVADLARRAELRTIDLWSRGRRAPDFLRLRVGLGTAKSSVEAPLADGGDDEFRDEARRALAGLDVLRGVPDVVDMCELGVMAVHGDSDVVTKMAAALTVQMATLHSPEDLIIVAAVSRRRGMADWLKWLPQTRSVTSPLSGRHLTMNPRDADSMISELIAVCVARLAERGDGARWPWLCAIIDDEVEPDPTLVAQLMDLAPGAGLSVIWMSGSEAHVPRQAQVVVDCETRQGERLVSVWYTDPGRPMVRVEPVEVSQTVADRLARSLAPVRDASVATATTAIPRTAPLLDVLGVDHPTDEWVLDRWNRRRPYGLQHPIGLSAEGVFSIDLVADGPHALIGGTSGAGKSELLQSIVASLVSLYPPNRLNFLFVDYKGGASSTQFQRTPHTVGYVTNLNADLAMRALVSLRAELNRRMRILEGRAKDLEEMLEKFPDLAPPSLVIVVDEFATLVKEIPDFVAGVVDIAQRGRSLGIHLILATQRPTGSVNENILANTNLRISLRMLDAGESNAIINSPEASQIPVPLRGRGFVRLGPRTLVAFQSAYAGAPLTRLQTEVPVVVEPFGVDIDPGARPNQTGGSGDPMEESSHLTALLDAVEGASRRGRYQRGRAPWRDVLPDVVVLSDVLRSGNEGDPSETVSRRPGRQVVLGLVDQPEKQEQGPAVVDLEEGGGLLVFGSGGSGKTTLLRTVAASVALDSSAGESAIFVFDFASRSLRSLEVLPQVVNVGTGDDLESVTRMITVLWGELERRRAALASARAETLSAYHDLGRDMERIIVLVDGYQNLSSAFQGGGFGNPLDVWLERFNRIVLEGRQVGIHAVITADRRAAVPGILQSAIANRVILRQADESAFLDHGIAASRFKGVSFEPGRGFMQDQTTVQVASVSAEAEGFAQSSAIEVVAAGLKGSEPDPAVERLRTHPMPTEVDVRDIEQPEGGLAIDIGLADVDARPVGIDLQWSGFLVSGPGRSGRTETLRTVAELMSDRTEVFFVGSHRAAPPSLRGVSGADPAVHVVTARVEEWTPLIERALSRAELSAGSSGAQPPVVLVIDGLDEIDDMSNGSILDLAARSENLRVVASVDARSVSGYTSNALLSSLRRSSQQLFLQPEDLLEISSVVGTRVTVRPGVALTPGSGVLMVDRQPFTVRVARSRR